MRTLPTFQSMQRRRLSESRSLALIFFFPQESSQVEEQRTRLAYHLGIRRQKTLSTKKDTDQTDNCGKSSEPMEGAEGNSRGAADNTNANAAAAGAGGGAGDDANNPAKRHAKVGQWRTPPVPFYGAGPPSGAGAVGGGGGVGMPGSESEYAMALQEAYRQGAASATSTSGGGSGGGGGMGMGSHAASCPDLGSLQPLLPPSGGSHGTLASVGEEEELTEEPDPQQQQQTGGYSYDHPAAPAAGGLGQMMGPNGVPTPLPLGPMRIPGAPAGPPSQQSYGGPSSYNHTSGNSAAHPGAPPSSSSGAIGGRGRPPSTTGRKPSSSSGAGARSVSMPDISSYAAQQDAEEAKRRKRLARNRASARLRRLKKKNLVDSYEGEVGVLEASLAKLRAHSWGVGSDPNALLEALSMDRGQQHIPAEKRKELIQSILLQQREQVATIRDVQSEIMMLGLFARYGEQDDEQKKAGEAKGDDAAAIAAEEAELARELQEVLNLSPGQKEQLQKTTEGLEEERRAIDTIDSCLEALASNDWLLNSGVEECTDRFMSILNPSQTSKFLLWADNNSEAIDQLDYVKAPPAGAPPVNAPTFYFGMEEGCMQGDAGEG